MVLLITVIRGFAAALGVIACVIGVLFTTAYLYLFVSHLWGQLHRRTELGAPLPAAPRF